MSRPDFELQLPTAEDEAGDAVATSDQRPDDDVMRALRRAAAAQPDDPDYWFMLGSAHARRGEDEEALTALREALRSPAAEASYRRSLGAALFRVGRLEEARDTFERVLAEHPGDARAASGLALCELRLERPAEAVRRLRGLRPPPAERAAHRSNLGAALWSAGDAAAAESAFRAACRARPRDPTFHRNLGRALLARGKPARAAACFREALRLDPRQAAGHFDLGDALFASGSHAEAEAAYERGAALGPGVAASRPQTQVAWNSIRLERTRDELGALAAPSLVSPVLARSLDLLHRIDRWLDVVATPGRRAATAGLVLLVLLFARVTLVVLPHYVAHYRLQDEVVELSRMPTRDDARVLQGVLDAARRHGRDRYLAAEAVRVSADRDRRRVAFRYEVELSLLPGLVARLPFRVEVEQPFVTEPEPIVL